MGLLNNDDDESDSNTEVNINEGRKQETMKGATHYRLELNLESKLVATWNSATESHLLTCKSDLHNFLQSYFFHQ